MLTYRRSLSLSDSNWSLLVGLGTAMAGDADGWSIWECGLRSEVEDTEVEDFPTLCALSACEGPREETLACSEAAWGSLTPARWDMSAANLSKGLSLGCLISAYGLSAESIDQMFAESIHPDTSLLLHSARSVLYHRKHTRISPNEQTIRSPSESF